MKENRPGQNLAAFDEGLAFMTQVGLTDVKNGNPKLTELGNIIAQGVYDYQRWESIKRDECHLAH